MPATNESASTPPRRDLQGRYGFALLNGDIHLVQLISCPAPRTYKANVFRHNFVSLFSYSHTQTLASGLLELLKDDDNGEARSSKCLLEEDTNTLFVTPDVMSRYVSLKDKLVPSLRMRPRRDLMTLRKGFVVQSDVLT